MNIIFDEEKFEKEWELEVYRNIHDLCVYCGKPMTTTIFHDVPVCDEHKDVKNKEVVKNE